MFIATRDLAYAKGRFFLMASVMALVAFLVTILSGLAGGLIKNNISGLIQIPATHIAFEWSDHPNYRNTMIERASWEGWAEQSGVLAAEPMGNTVFNARSPSEVPLEIALWGMRPGSFVEPPVIEGESLGRLENGVIISKALVNDGVAIGDIITLDRVLTELQVVGITGERNIGHLPIIFAALPKWQEATYGPPGGAPPGEKLPDILFDFVSVIALQLDESVEIEAADESFETLTLGRQKFYEASTGYTDEIKSVQLIQWLLIVISAVVIGAFFSIWTIQRTKEIGLVKALGASNGFLMRDALGQALILMLIGTGAGLGIALWVGSVIIAKTTTPFMYQVSIVMSSTTLLLVAGLIGGFLSILRITSVDPIIALGQEQ